MIPSFAILSNAAVKKSEYPHAAESHLSNWHIVIYTVSNTHEIVPPIPSSVLSNTTPDGGRNEGAYRERSRRVFELLFERVNMIGIHMRIAQHMNQVTGLQACYLQVQIPESYICLGTFSGASAFCLDDTYSVEVPERILTFSNRG